MIFLYNISTLIKLDKHVALLSETVQQTVRFRTPTYLEIMGNPCLQKVSVIGTTVDTLFA
jgi:hypothetical protein